METSITGLTFIVIAASIGLVGLILFYISKTLELHRKVTK